MIKLPPANPEIKELEDRQSRRQIFVIGGIVTGILMLCAIVMGGILLTSFDGTSTPPTIIAATADTPTLAATTEPLVPTTIEPSKLPSTDQPAAEPSLPPKTKPTQEPTTEPIQQPTKEQTAEPTAPPTDEPASPSTAEPVTEPTAEPTQEPSSEPLSGKIAVPVFEKAPNNIDDTYNLYLASAENGWVPKLLFERASQPAFTKDGKGMILRSWNHHNWAQSIIYLPDYTNLTDFRQMTTFVEGAHPKLSSGNEIVFHRWRKNQQPIIKKLGTYPGAEKDEKNQMQLAEGRNPDWLDNERIIFYASFSQAGLSEPGLYVVDAGGSNPTRILTSGQPLVPSVAPDGNRVAVSMQKDDRWQVFTFSASQGEASLTQLTSTPDADNYLPTWSPNGEHIAFVSNRNKQWKVWTMKADGSEQSELFNLPGSIDGKISDPNIDPALSFGWGEERLSWAP